MFTTQWFITYFLHCSYHVIFQIVTMVFNAIKKLSIEHSQPFFKLMSMLVEFGGGPPGLPPFTQYCLQRFWDVS